eukprot:3716370-Pyramimonas_sp.AAC.1
MLPGAPDPAWGCEEDVVGLPLVDLTQEAANHAGFGQVPAVDQPELDHIDLRELQQLLRQSSLVHEDLPDHAFAGSSE